MVGTAEQLDHGNERDVELAGGELVRQTARQVVPDADAPGGEAVHERLRVQVADGADAL